ncbi:RPB4 [Auxenochlorella protothecoides x Auxenochlorella symbiontica]
MFVLCTLEDKVRLAPKDLRLDTADAVTAVLEKTYLDRVIPDLGLVVTLYDLLEIGDGYVFQSDGGVHHDTTFRVVAFRPSQEEVLVGEVISQDERTGVHVGLGFFEDIIIPPYGMPEPHSWDPEEKAWSWDLEGEEGASQLYFETGLPVRLQVTGLTYTPPPTPVDQSAAQSRGDPIPGSADCPHAPLVVTAKADGDGLGMVHWYDEGAMEEGS